MSEGCVQPCLSWSAFKVMSLMTCPFCFRTVCRRYESTVPPTAGYVLGTDLNCSESLGCHRQGAVSIPLKPRTYLSRCLGKPGVTGGPRYPSGPLFRLTSVPIAHPRRGYDFGGTGSTGERHLRLGRMRRRVAPSRSNSIGLGSNSLHPAASAFSRSPASACADSAIIGISRVCGLPLSLRVAS